MAFSPDGRWVIASGGEDLRPGGVRVWDVPTGREALTLRGTHQRPVRCAVSPDGTRIATISQEGTVHLWDAITGQELRAFRGHTAAGSGLAFSPDGTRIATADEDGIVKLWDAATGQETLTLKGHTGKVHGVAFSPDGTRIATASADGTVRIWDARPPDPDASAEREAMGLLDFLFSRPLRRADVVEHLRTSPTLRPAAREKALAWVARYHEETDPERYHQGGWALLPPAVPERLPVPPRPAPGGRRLPPAPGTGRYLTALGAAHYRFGQYPEALTSLTEADRLNQGHPADLVFLAMIRWRLGREEEARATFARLRETPSRAPASRDDDLSALVAEARGLIGAADDEETK